jgi:hypothetical protein
MMMKTILISIFIFVNCIYSFSQVTFTDVSVTLGVNDPGAAQGVVFVDVNNDGFLDIFLCNNANQNKLWINSNGTSYSDQSVAWGVDYTGPGRGISVADFDNDGKVDVMIGNYNAALILYKNTGTAFTDYTTTAGINFTGWGGSINWFDYNIDGKVDAVFANDGIPPHYNYLFRNDNLLSFTNVAYSSGLSDSNSTLCLASADYDNDGDLDLFCGNQTVIGTVYTSWLYRNNGNGTFTDVTAASGLTCPFYTWGAEWGDYNNDGWMDIFTGNTNGLILLYKNNGDGTFTEVAASVGINDQGQTYSGGWADIDNDGDLDLYLAKAQNYADKMYRNDGATFTDVGTQVGMGDLRHSSCISWGDYNNDGWMDLYLNNNGSENRLYKNNGGSNNKWVQFKLIGVISNKSAIGSRVTIKTGALTQIREVEGGSGGKGQNSLPVEFGIGAANIIDSVIIRWQNGLIQRFANVNPNYIYSIIEGQPLDVKNAGAIVPEKFMLYQNYPNPFNPSTVISYSVGIPSGQLAVSSYTKLTVYDLLGREVATLVNEQLKPGTYEVEWDGSNFASGIYYYKLIAGDYSETRKMVMVK